MFVMPSLAAESIVGKELYLRNLSYVIAKKPGNMQKASKMVSILYPVLKTFYREPPIHYEKCISAGECSFRKVYCFAFYC